MAHAFAIAPAAMTIGITVYLIATAVFLPLSGWVADRFGARNVFAGAIVIFTVSSFFCGVSGQLWQFIAARAVQGLGGALMAPVGRMVVLRNAPKSELIQATALITWPALIAPVIGPALGGFITTYASWRWNFEFNIPLGLIGLALVLRFVPNERSDQRRPLDVPGFLLSAAALSVLLYGLDGFSHMGGPWWPPAAAIAAGVGLGALSIRHFRSRRHPLLELSSLEVPTFSATSLGAGILFRMTISATPFLLPLMFQVGFGFSPVMSGLMILAYFGGNLGMKTVTTPTLRRYGFRNVLVWNGIIAGAAILACAGIMPQAPLVAAVILVVAGLSRSMQFTSLNTLAFADVSADQRASASTLSSMLSQVGMGLGVAAGGLLLNLSQAARGAAGLATIDFRVAFVVIGAVAIASSALFLRLDPDAGAEVSGRA
jgi:EmrB/QacA subfamily drug resistance transporter